MVQIIGQRPSGISRFVQNATPGIESLLGKLLEKKSTREKEEKGLSERTQEDTALKRLGIDVGGVANPRLREELVEQSGKQRTSTANTAADAEGIQAIGKYFGPEAAEIYPHLTEGGKTKFFQSLIESKQRNIPINEMLGQFIQENPQDLQMTNQQGPQSQEGAPEMSAVPEKAVPQINSKGELPKDFQWPDYDKRPGGYTPKEWIDEKKTWRKENAPVFEESKNRLKNNERDALGIKSLSKLNNTKDVGEGFERTLINPNTGDFYGLAQLAHVVSPESQQWVKEIARFGNRAKDAFGSRVTNFDLMQYMKQFPGLLNTYEGRRRILGMMDVNNRLDKLYDSSLKQIYQKKGLGGIPQEEADRLAQEFIEDETEKLREEYLDLDMANQEGEGESTQNLPEGTVLMYDPQGNALHVPQDKVEELTRLGARPGR